MVGITLHKTLHAALATLANPEVGKVTEEYIATTMNAKNAVVLTIPKTHEDGKNSQLCKPKPKKPNNHNSLVGVGRGRS